MVMMMAVMVRVMMVMMAVMVMEVGIERRAKATIKKDWDAKPAMQLTIVNLLFGSSMNILKNYKTP